MKIRLDRIISIATLVASLGAVVLVLKKPAPVAQPQTPAAIAVLRESGFASASARRIAQRLLGSAAAAPSGRWAGPVLAESSSPSDRQPDPGVGAPTHPECPG